MTLRTLNYGNYGIFLIMGHAGFCPSAVWIISLVTLLLTLLRTTHVPPSRPQTLYPYRAPIDPFKETLYPYRVPIDPFKETLYPYRVPIDPFKETLYPYRVPIDPFKETLYPYRVPIDPFKGALKEAHEPPSRVPVSRHFPGSASCLDGWSCQTSQMRGGECLCRRFIGVLGSRVRV